MSDADDTPVPVDAPGEARDRRPVADRRTWLTVARKDFADAGRSWQLYVLGAVFTATAILGGLSPLLRDMVRTTEYSTASFQRGLASMMDMTGFVVPLVVLLFGHMAIVGQVERGSLRTLLAFPVSRRDVVLGTLLGRTAAVVTTISGGLLVGFVAMWLLYDSSAPLAYAGTSVSILAFSACFVAMAVGISAATRTRGRALALAIGAFAVTTFLWGVLLSLVRLVAGVSVIRYLDEPDQAPGWYVFLDRVHPGTALRHVVSNWVVPVFPSSGVGDTLGRPTLTTPGPEPFYLDAWALAVVLLAWGLVPLVIGYWRFRDAEVM